MQFNLSRHWRSCALVVWCLLISFHGGRSQGGGSNPPKMSWCTNLNSTYVKLDERGQDCSDASTYFIQITEEISSNVPLILFSAIDPENDAVTMTLTGSEQATFYFKLVPDRLNRSAVLMSNSRLDADSLGRIVMPLTIQLDDGNLNVVTATFQLVIVADINDNRPEFLNQPYRWEIPENTEPSASLTFPITAIDRDVQAAGMLIEFKEVSGASISSVFNFSEVNTTSCSQQVNLCYGRLSYRIISLIRALDYETNRFYQIAVNATDKSDGGVSTFTDVIINVLDRQDTPPFFQGIPYVKTVPENSPNGTFLLKIFAEDGDRGVPNAVSYRLDPKNPFSKYFNLNNATGDLTLSSVVLDRESEQIQNALGTFDLPVIATEVSAVPQPSSISQATSSVRIIVEDKNDLAPRFSSTEYNATVIENTTPGVPITIDGIVTVVDFDSGFNGEFNLTVMKNNASYDNFDVSPVTVSREATLMVRVRNVSFLDYESIKSDTFQIVARETRTSERFSSTATIHLRLIDANDNRPVFNRTSGYVFNIPENAVNGTRVGMVYATDADSGQNGLVSYMLDGTDAYKFRINKTTGEIFVNVDADKNLTLLNRETISKIFLTALATDGGGFISSTVLEINLLDVNDQTPQFNRNQYSGFVRENSLTFESLVQVQAIDDDLKGSNNSLVMYRIVAGDPGDNFNITALTGILGVRLPLDFEALTTTNIINLTVMAYDAGLPSLNSTVTVTVTVLDQNDNSPSCIYAQFNGTVAENAIYGTPVVQINASDLDAPGGDNSRIFYRIQSGAADKFTMSGDSGLISVERGADLDVNKFGDRYNLTVAVFDMGSPQRSGSCLVAINVIDVNNQRPYFDTITRRETIPENPPINMPLPISPQYTAKDPDTSANLQYSIIYSEMKATEANGQPVDPRRYNFTDLLFISSTNGTLFVKNIMDRERAQEIYVPILVRDLSAEPPLLDQTATGTLIITLSDINDEPPVFLPPAVNNTYRISVSEGLVPPTEISLTVMATDFDSSSPGLTYAVRPSTTPFTVKHDTGQLSLNASLDREKQEQLTFYVLANDSVHIATATVYVTVSDVNDIVPTFYGFAANLNVSEGLSVDSLLTTVKAYDNDTGLFGTVRYRILSGNDGRFFINDTTGELRLARALDRDVAGGSAYNLLIEAFDNPGGTDSQRSSRSMAITVLDVNDNAPRFLSNNYTITTLLESMEANQMIREISATDIDADINAQMNFSFSAIPGQNSQGLNLFQVSTKHSDGASIAVISTRRSLVGAVGWYNLTLVATDLGTPTQTGSTNVTLFIADVNDQHPQFVYPNTTDTVLQVNESSNASSTIGKSLIQVQATDRDFGNNSVIRFDLTSSSGDHNAFSIDTVSGLIRITVSLDYETKPEYRFQVRARDLGTPPLTSQINLIVQVLNVDEGPPAFPPASRVQSFSLPENSAPSVNIPGLNRTGVLVGSLAKAVDPDVITMSSAVCYFILDKVYDTFYLNKSGELYSLKSFDREAQSQYTIHIVAVGPSECNSNKYQWRNAPTPSRTRRYLDDSPVAFDPSNPTMARIVVNIADTNDNPPVWSAPIYYGGVNVNDPPGTTVFSFANFVTDLDTGNNSALTYSMTPVLASTSQLAMQLQERNIYATVFAMDNRTGVVRTGERTYFQESMSGSLHFNVTVSDSTYSAVTSCTIYLLSLDQQLIITVADVPANVTRYRDAFISYLSNITGWQVVVNSIVTHKKSDGSADPTKSDVYIHAIDRRDNSIVPAITVQNRIDQLSSQMIVLYRQFGVLYVKLARQTTPIDQTLEILKIALIAVACGLTVLLFFSCISLWTCRRMYRRKLKAATAVAFGPSGQQNSNLKTPGTNIHAYEGSNPIWMNEIDNSQFDNRAYESDKDSIDNNQINLAPAPTNGAAKRGQPQFDEVEKSMRFSHDNGLDADGSNADDRRILDTAVRAGPSVTGNGSRPRNGSLTAPMDLFNQPTTQI